MNARIGVPIACIAILTLAAGTAATAGAAEQQLARYGQLPHATTTGRGPAASRAPSSYALMSVGTKLTQFAAPLSGGLAAGVPKSINDASTIVDTDMDATGTTALIADDAAQLNTIINIRNAPHPGADIPLGQFDGEGGPTYVVFSDGVAITNHAALVAVTEHGVVQLRETRTGFRIDKRVHSPGRSEVGTPHAPGFIRIPATPAGNSYSGVTVSKVPLPNGKFLGLALDRSDNALAVIEGVGTARPTVVGQLVSSDFHTGTTNWADGGMAFSPATATRAVVATRNGVDVLNLSHPKHPKLQSPTTIGTVDKTTSVTVAPDGDTVVASNVESVYTMRGLLGSRGNPLTAVGNFMPYGFNFRPRALAFTPNNRLVVQYDAEDPISSTNIEDLSSYPGVTATGHPSGSANTVLSGLPDVDNTMSVFPVPNPRLHPASLGRHLRVGRRVHVALSVVGVVGRYSFHVTGGSLPAGLHLRRHAITGRPKHAGRRHVTITAVNQYGGAVIARRLVRIRR